jgi:hypothetical protein
MMIEPNFSGIPMSASASYGLCRLSFITNHTKIIKLHFMGVTDNAVVTTQGWATSCENPAAASLRQLIPVI